MDTEQQQEINLPKPLPKPLQNHNVKLFYLQIKLLRIGNQRNQESEGAFLELILPTDLK